jgi:hypothetical protein
VSDTIKNAFAPRKQMGGLNLNTNIYSNNTKYDLKNENARKIFVIIVKHKHTKINFLINYNLHKINSNE